MKAEYDFSNARPNPYVDKLGHGAVEADSGERRSLPLDGLAKFVDESTLPISWPEDASDNPTSKA